MTTPHFRNRQDEQREFGIGTGFLNVLVTTFFDGVDTEVRVTVASSDWKERFYGEGFAFLNPKDVYDAKLGAKIAYIRALRDALADAELDAISETREWVERAAFDEKKHQAFQDNLFKKVFPEEPTKVNNCAFCAKIGADLSKPCPAFRG